MHSKKYAENYKVMHRVVFKMMGDKGLHPPRRSNPDRVSTYMLSLFRRIF